MRLSLLIMAAALAACASTEGAYEREAEDLAASRPFAIASVSRPLIGTGRVGAGTWTLLGFYNDNAAVEPSRDGVSANDDGRRWVVKGLSGADLGREWEAWAVSDSCPALISILEQMEAVQPPPVDVPWIGPELEHDGIVVTADGPAYRLWSDSLPEQARTLAGDPRVSAQTIWYEVEAWAGVDSPLADWMEAALSALGPCWGETPP